MRKITALLLVVLMIMSSIISVQAGSLEKPQVIYNYEKGLLTVSGVATPGEELTVYVINPGYERDSVYTYGETAVQNFRVINADENGEYVYALKLADAVKGTYSVYVKGETMPEVKNSFVYADNTEIESIISALNGESDANAINTVISAQTTAGYLQVDTFEPFIQADKAELSVLLAEILKDYNSIKLL